MVLRKIPQPLPGPEHPIAGIAQARHDVAVVVQSFVKRGCPYRDFAVDLLEMRDAFRSGQQAYEANVAGAASLQQ
jgi:hypothetical protein